MESKNLPFSPIRIALYIVFLFIFSNCKKTNHSSPSGSIQDIGTISANLGNLSFKSAGTIAALDKNGMFDITGAKPFGGDTTQLEIAFPDTLSANMTYQDSTGILFVVTYSDPGQALLYRTGFGKPSGTLKLTSIDRSKHTISGSFSGSLFSAGDPSGTVIAVTNGIFNTGYTATP